jgi:hypothetical protein
MGKAKAAVEREVVLIEFLRLEMRIKNLGLVATVRRLNEAKNCCGWEIAHLRAARASEDK